MQVRVRVPPTASCLLRAGGLLRARPSTMQALATWRAGYIRIDDQDEDERQMPVWSTTEDGGSFSNMPGLRAGILAITLGCAVLALSFSFSVRHPPRHSSSKAVPAAASFFTKGPPAWALSRTLPRAQQHVSSSSSSFTGSSFKDQQDFPQNVTIKLVSYPSDWFGTYHLLEEDGWLGYLLERYSPPEVRWNLTEYTYEEYDSLLVDLSAGVYEAGTVFLYKTNLSSAAIVEDSDYYRDVDQGCMYCFGDGNLLVYDELTRMLLSSATPYTLIFNGDWCCQTSFPETSHQILRTDFGVNVMQNVDGVFPFGTESTLELEFLAGLLRNDMPLVSERGYLLSFVGMLTYRKPTRIAFNHSIMTHMTELQAVADKHSTDDQTLSLVYDAEWCYVDSYHFEEQTNRTYLQILGDSMFSLVPAGDAYWGGRFFQALEYGAIPVIEDFETFKGCDQPTQYLKDWGVPVLMVKEWDSLPRRLDGLLSDRKELDERAAAIKSWWEMFKAVSIHRLVDFAVAARAGEVGTHECTTTALTSDEEQAALSAYEDYYSSDTWYSDFEDSPEYCSFFCTTTIDADAVTEDDACFSADCAPKPISDFTCSIVADEEGDDVLWGGRTSRSKR